MVSIPYGVHGKDITAFRGSRLGEACIKLAEVLLIPTLEIAYFFVRVVCLCLDFYRDLASVSVLTIFWFEITPYNEVSRPVAILSGMIRLCYIFRG